MSLTKYETETVINFNDAEDMAEIYTCNRAWINRLDKLCLCTPEIIRKKADEYSRTYIIPKKYIKVRIPRQLSDEKRTELILRAKKNLHADKQVWGDLSCHTTTGCNAANARFSDGLHATR